MNHIASPSAREYASVSLGFRFVVHATLPRSPFWLLIPYSVGARAASFEVASSRFSFDAYAMGFPFPPYPNHRVASQFRR